MVSFVVISHTVTPLSTHHILEFRHLNTSGPTTIIILTARGSVPSSDRLIHLFNRLPWIGSAFLQSHSFTRVLCDIYGISMKVLYLDYFFIS